MTELGGVENHVREQAFKVCLALVSDGAFHKGVDCALKELDIEGTGFNQGYELSEQVLRLDNEAKVTEGFLNDSLLVFLVLPCFLVGDVIVLEELRHIFLGSVGEVVIEYHSEDVVLKLVSFHVATESVSHRP